MSKPTERTQERTQKAGAYAALAVAGLFVIVIAYFVVFGGGGKGKVAKGPGPRADDSPVPLGQVTDSQLRSAKGVRFDLTDKKDPTKRTGVVNFAAMDPLEGHRYAVEQPEAWLFLSGGGLVYIRADAGQVYSPEGQKELESGTIRGNVEIRLFEQGDPATMDPKTAPATMVATTDSLSFDAAVREGTTADSFVVKWDGGTFEGEGLSLVMDEVNQRLARGEVHRNGKLTVTTAKRARKKTEPPSAGGGTPPPSTVELQTAAAKPVETLYRLIGSGKVVATHATRKLTADKFLVMARLLDNALPEGAIQEVLFAREEKKGSGPTAAPGSAASPAAGEKGGVGAAEVSVASQTPAKTDQEPLVMTWSGPCVIVPITAAAELERDHLAARFSADGDGKVVLSDTERGISGHAAAIEYGTTTRRLSLIGPDPMSVKLSVPESGQIETRRLDADLGTGVVKAPGAGTLKSKRGEDEKEQTLAWAERGEFVFQTSEQGLTGWLKDAVVAGEVRGDGRGLAFTSNEAHASFAPGKPGQKQPDLLSVDLTGNAIANSADTGTMEGGKIHVEFDAPPPPTALATSDGKRREARARFVRAEDGFKVERDGQKLSGGYLESRLIDVGEGKVDVGSVLARNGVEFASARDFISGKTEELTADLGFDENGKRKQLVNLVGEGTYIQKDEPGVEQGKVTGTQLAIDGVRGGLEGFGVGTFSYLGLKGTETASLDASWTRRMVFDDAGGLIDCWGDSKAEYSPEVNTKNKVDADRVKLFFTPRNEGPSLFSTRRDEAGAGGGARPKREIAVVSAEAYGSILDREGGVNAQIESRTYSGGELQKLSYVEGPSILANNEKGTLNVPGAGKFLLMDQTPAKEAAAKNVGAPGIRDLGGDARGVSLFEWATSLNAEKQPSGETVMVMKDGVGVVHRALADGRVTEIKCVEITANLKDRAGSLGETSRGMELQSVTAIGSVYAASGPPKTKETPRPELRELIAQRLEYDAVKRKIDARANADGVVTMFDPAAASPTTAAWLTWDLTNNSVQVRQPAGVVPR